MKKTLITKLSLDMTPANDEQIEAMKAYMRASFAPAGMGIDFEVVTEGSDDPLSQWLALLRDFINSPDVPNDGKDNTDNEEVDDEEEDGVETVIRIDAQGKIIGFPGNDGASSGQLEGIDG